MKVQPITHAGYKLFHEGSIALAQVEANGLKIDTEYLSQAIKDTDIKIVKLKERLKRSKLYKTWLKHYGTKINLGSQHQLGEIVFNVAKIAKGEKTEKGGKYKTDVNTLEDIEHPFIEQYMKLTRLNTTRNTFLATIQKHTEKNGYMHPCYNLHLARSMRSSVDSPNGQNIPIRDEEMASVVRPCFIPRSKNRQICEHDFSGIEVKTSACYNLDPKLIKYIKDKRTDMHRDMGMQIYIATIDEMTKQIRHCAKNKFVFPEFYGDWYLSCAKSLWQAVKKQKLETADGVPLYEHLQQHGIRGLGRCVQSEDPLPHTFEKHLKEVEHDFWNNRFKVYNQWKYDFYDEYVRKGYFDTLTGFRISGDLDRKKVVNYPIQGSAFHCLLWSLIRVQKLLRKYNMKTLLIGQIHDSIIADVSAGELSSYVEIAHKVMTEDLLRHYPWIIVPMEAEAEVAPLGESWYAKKSLVT